MIITANSYKKPDLNSPRFKSKRDTIITNIFYDQFKEKYPQYAHIPNNQLGTIIKAYNTTLWKEVVESRDGTELPESLGYLFIGSCPRIKKLTNTDKATSEKLGIQVPHRNFESDSFIAKIFYTNFANKYKFHAREMWTFVALRPFKRTVAKTYPVEWKKYVQVDSTKHIWKLFTRLRKREFAQKSASKIDEGYNEFKMD